MPLGYQPKRISEHHNPCRNLTITFLRECLLFFPRVFSCEYVSESIYIQRLRTDRLRVTLLLAPDGEIRHDYA